MMVESFEKTDISEILLNYRRDRRFYYNLNKILNTGLLSGTGKMLILPVDQGFEHGPDASFSSNPVAYDPMYHFNMAVEGGFSAYVAPIGMLEMCPDHDTVPLILKINSSSVLFVDAPDQTITATVEDACRLGCVGIGMTIYPGSPNFKSMIERLVPIISKAKRKGLVIVIWSYPRGAGLQGVSETSEYIISYAAHIACLLGADIVKVKPPTVAYDGTSIGDDYGKLENSVRNIIRSCFNGKRLVLFSGGKIASDQDMYKQIATLYRAGASGSILGRNIFQRKKSGALSLVNGIVDIYKNKK
ncbi:MAG: fructose-biphosphate aldolase, class I [Candidatus Xenolissoclinum pacificiensis L6]|uniref:fructose-bisphosphate aldolase n=1 Tax=Candidatus Xenolissoclinum pacificiensis L6 TaxID=1401685 RepID=W2V278_9RICK|nr:MAG: fructose-biphosphate aldolase, class I [Candidatus Xenolissoclinum pacificiensis L6]